MAKTRTVFVENCIHCNGNHQVGFTFLTSGSKFIDGNAHGWAGVCPENREIIYLRYDEVEDD